MAVAVRTQLIRLKVVLGPSRASQDLDRHAMLFGWYLSKYVEIRVLMGGMASMDKGQSNQQTRAFWGSTKQQVAFIATDHC
jgi:hypothetical protein